MPASLSDIALPNVAAAAPRLCRHCGDPCTNGSVTGQDGVFCCTGCEAVFLMLQSRGLGDYYQASCPPGVSQKALSAQDRARFAGLDDEGVAARYLEFNDTVLARAAFSVPSMHCGSCLWVIERLWKVDPGILSAEADLLRRTVRVTFRPAAISLRRVAEHLSAIGYEPVLDGERSAGKTPVARRDLYLKIGLAGFSFGNIMLFSVPRYANGGPIEGGFQHLFDALNIAFALPVLFYSAADYFRAAWHGLRTRTMSLEVPVAMGLLALFLRSLYDITTGLSEGFMDSFTGLVLFLLVGRLFQQKAFDRIAFDRTFRSFFPISVRLERGPGADVSVVPLEQVRVGDRVIVRPQEVIPADAVVLDAEAAVDYAFITGEQTPIPVSRGETVRAGGRAAGRAMRVAVTRDVSHSQLAGLWNNAAFSKSKTYWLSQVSSRFGTWFTVVALVLAAAGVVGWWPDSAKAVQVATAVLIIACPCALTLAAPITLGTAMGMLGRAGFYLKNPAVALNMSRIDTVAFDKTGTLTSMGADVRAEPVGLSEREWRLARRLAAESIHPASRAIAAAGAVAGHVDSSEEVPGQGIRGRVDGHLVAIGSAAFVSMETGAVVNGGERRVAVAIDGRLRGWVTLSSAPRAGVTEAARQLSGDQDLWLVSGDHDGEASAWSRVFGDHMAFRQTPEDKLAFVSARQADGRHVLMVGDGLNDAGALAAADVGVAVSDQTACVVPSCDAVIRGDRLEYLPAFLRYARRARQVVILCFVVSLFYNAIGLTFALTGVLSPLVTAILMPVSSLTIVGLSHGAMRWYARGALPECP